MKLFFKLIAKVNKLLVLVTEVLRYENLFTIIYSQEGEDVLLRRLFNNQTNGFYVDVGAHHPMRFSNTYIFYKAGWEGINIEPNPDSLRLFDKHRPRDTNVNCGVARENGRLEYFMFDEPALNTFDKEMLKGRVSNAPYKHIKTIQIDVMPLAEVLERHLPENTKVDFLSVDVEGFDLDVIKSNDWEKFRPMWVLVEQLELESIEDLDFALHHYMKSIGYVLFAKTYNTLFYKNMSV